MCISDTGGGLRFRQELDASVTWDPKRKEDMVLVAKWSNVSEKRLRHSRTRRSKEHRFRLAAWQDLRVRDNKVLMAGEITVARKIAQKAAVRGVGTNKSSCEDAA